MIENDYKVIPSTLSSLVDGMDRGSQEDIVIPQEETLIPSIEELPAEHDDTLPVDFSDPESPPKPGGGVSKAQGRIVARVIDRGAATGLSVLAKGDITDYKATDDEYADLEEAVILYMQETNMQISPLWSLILAILAIYGLKVPEALKARKAAEKLEREEQAKLIAEREAQLRGGIHEPSTTGAA